MKNIVYIGKYNGIVGGIERYMQNSAELLRKNGFAVHYLYTENGGRDQEKFAQSFDSIAEFSPPSTFMTRGPRFVVSNSLVAVAIASPLLVFAVMRT